MDDVLALIAYEGPSTGIATTLLSSALRYFATNEASAEVFDDVEKEKITSFVSRMLSISVEGRADIDESDVDEGRARTALRTLVNAANRAPRIRDCVPEDCLPISRVLLRIPSLRRETLAALVAFSKTMHSAFGLHPDYHELLGELAILWEKCEDDNRSWISALFSLHLENDYAFVAHCFKDLKPDQFSALLNCAETLLDTALTNQVIKIHENNMQFCVDLVERIIYDFGENTLDEEQKSVYLEWMVYLFEIIGNGALHRDFYLKQLHGRTDAIRMITNILDTIVDATAALDIANPPSVSTAPDRPAPVLPTRRQTVVENPALNAISESLQTCNVEVKAHLKCAAVRAIGNLCCDNEANRLEAGRHDAVILVLSSANLTPNDRPFIVQWSIATLRYLCLGCPENQAVLASIDSKPTGIIDRGRLLKDLGVECTIGEDGRVNIKGAMQTIRK